MTGKQALEYRDPQPVEYEKDHYFGTMVKCPRCQEIFIPSRKTKFCSHCGQALSFGEVDHEN